MNVINITDFKQNISSYFDELISTKNPIYITRRKHKIIVISLDDLNDEEIKLIENIGSNKDVSCIKNKDWVNTFNKVSWSEGDTIILW